MIADPGETYSEKPAVMCRNPAKKLIPAPLENTWVSRPGVMDGVVGEGQKEGKGKACVWVWTVPTKCRNPGPEF
jgi:hypothetical protein